MFFNFTIIQGFRRLIFTYFLLACTTPLPGLSRIEVVIAFGLKEKIISFLVMKLSAEITVLLLALIKGIEKFRMEHAYFTFRCKSCLYNGSNVLSGDGEDKKRCP